MGHSISKRALFFKRALIHPRIIMSKLGRDIELFASLTSRHGAKQISAILLKGFRNHVFRTITHSIKDQLTADCKSSFRSLFDEGVTQIGSQLTRLDYAGKISTLDTSQYSLIS